MIKKILALNHTIQVWHRDVPILEHYLKDYYSSEVREFLDWLQNVNVGMFNEGYIKLRTIIRECINEIVKK